MKKQRSASPSQAIVSSTSSARAISMISRRFSSSSGLGPMVGEVAVGHPVVRHRVEPQLVEQPPDHGPRPCRGPHQRGTAELDASASISLTPRPELLVDVGVLDRPAAGRLADPVLDWVADTLGAGVAGEHDRPLPDQLRPRCRTWGCARRCASRPRRALRADEPVEHLRHDHPRVDDGSALGHHPAAVPPAISGACSRMSRPRPIRSSDTRLPARPASRARRPGRSVRGVPVDWSG